MRNKLFYVAVLAAGAAVSHANLVTNGSFEDGSFVPNGDNTMDLPSGSTAMTGWLVVNSNVAWIADPNPFNGVLASDGVKSLDLTSYGGDAGGVMQTLGTVAGNIYTVEFDLGANNAYGDSSLRVLAAGDSHDFTLTSPGGQDWEHETWSFTATGSTTDLEFGHFIGANNYTGLDNVSVTGVVPEPATMALLGLVPLALRRRKK